MRNRKASRRRAVDAALTARGYTRDGAQRRALRRRVGTAAAQRGLTRREFIERIGLAGATLGAPALVAGCGGSDDATAPAAATERRTLFFNLSHVAAVDTTHWLYAGGGRHRLVKTGDAPHVLQGARSSNEFLRAVPDDKITHHLEDVALSSTIVTLGYLTCNEEPATGTWQMTSMCFNIPSGAVSHAYAQARAALPAGALRLSAKRRTYGVRAALTEQDLHDEHALIDSNSHAEALVGLHPDLLSAEPSSAAHVHHNYISPDSSTQFLSGLLQTMGPAAPEGTPSVNGATPWATLRPLLDDSKTPPVPFKKSDGKLNQYLPDWDPQVDQSVVSAIGNVHPQVTNDESLGADATRLAAPNAPREALRGKLWHRSDGVTTVLHAATAAQLPSTLHFDFQHKSFDAGLGFPDPVTTLLADGRVQVKLDNIYNWFLRFLGVYVRFYNANGDVIPVAKLPNDTIPGQTSVESALNLTNAPVPRRPAAALHDRRRSGRAGLRLGDLQHTARRATGHLHPRRHRLQRRRSVHRRPRQLPGGRGLPDALRQLGPRDDHDGARRLDDRRRHQDDRGDRRLARQRAGRRPHRGARLARHHRGRRHRPGGPDAGGHHERARHQGPGGDRDRARGDRRGQRDHRCDPDRRAGRARGGGDHRWRHARRDGDRGRDLADGLSIRRHVDARPRRRHPARPAQHAFPAGPRRLHPLLQGQLPVRQRHRPCPRRGRCKRPDREVDRRHASRHSARRAGEHLGRLLRPQELDARGPERLVRGPRQHRSVRQQRRPGAGDHDPGNQDPDPEQHAACTRARPCSTPAGATAGPTPRPRRPICRRRTRSSRASATSAASRCARARRSRRSKATSAMRGRRSAAASATAMPGRPAHPARPVHLASSTCSPT